MIKEAIKHNYEARQSKIAKIQYAWLLKAWEVIKKILGITLIIAGLMWLLKH